MIHVDADKGTKRAFEFSGFRLSATLLSHCGETVGLAPKAVDLLYLLASRAPEVVTKDEILQAVWPGTFVVESSLARNISLIRKALEEKGGPGPYIETIPTRGYRFVAPISELRPVATPLSAGNPAPAEVTPLPPTTQPRTDPTGSRAAWGVRLTVVAAALVLSGIGWRFVTMRARAAHPAELIGWHLQSKGAPAEMLRALASFELAVREAPRSAGAHAGLAQTILLLPFLAGGGTERFAEAKKEAETAIRLDPESSAGHAALGGAQMLLDWDMAAAERSLRRALELDPKNVPAVLHYSRLLSWKRRNAEAAALLRNAQRLDPVSPVIGVEMGRVLYEMRDFAAAERQLNSVLEREKNFALAHYFLGLTYGFLGRYEEAEHHLRATELQEGVLRTDRAWLRLLQGDRGPAEAAFRATQRLIAEGRFAPSSVLLLSVVLGRNDDAMAALNSAVRERAVELLSIPSDPRIESLRADPRYHAILGRLGRP